MYLCNARSLSHDWTDVWYSKVKKKKVVLPAWPTHHSFVVLLLHWLKLPPHKKLSGEDKMPSSSFTETNLVNLYKEILIKVTTRKSSCVNARGTPPAASQVLAMLLCLMGGGGGTPPTIQTWSGGYPLPRPEIGYPPHLGRGTPLTQTWDVVPPTQTWDGVPPYRDLRWGTLLTWDGVPPPPPRKCGQSENITSRLP